MERCIHCIVQLPWSFMLFFFVWAQTLFTVSSNSFFKTNLCSCTLSPLPPSFSTLLVNSLKSSLANYSFIFHTFLLGTCLLFLTWYIFDMSQTYSLCCGLYSKSLITFTSLTSLLSCLLVQKQFVWLDSCVTSQPSFLTNMVIHTTRIMLSVLPNSSMSSFAFYILYTTSLSTMYTFISFFMFAHIIMQVIFLLKSSFC